MQAKQIVFIKNIADAAMESMGHTGVPASVTIAQAILESGWGASMLAREANNFFGVKARQDAHYVEMKTTEFEHGVPVAGMAKFAYYASVAESFRAHALLLCTLPRYKPAMEVCGTGVVGHAAEFARQLQACGYSTNPNYAELLMQLVLTYNLTQYDSLPANPPNPSGPASAMNDPNKEAAA